MKRALLPLVLAWLSLAACAGSATAQRHGRGVEARAQAWVEKHLDEQILFLEETVNINSGTMNLKGVREVGALYRKAFDAIGMKTNWIELPESMGRAGHLVATQTGAPGAKRLLLIGHLDTVFELESPFQRFTRQGHMATGPGTVDMKGGNAVILYALRALHAAGALDSLNITVIFTGDEEKPGAPLATTRHALIEAAKASDVALGFESIVDHMDTATIARRGFRGWVLTVEGKQGHSSQIFGSKFGYGAIYEVARILNAFRERLGGEENLTFSPGRILGGTELTHDMEAAKGEAFGKSNVIPKRVEAVGDLRALTPEQVERTQAAMQAIVAANLPGTTAKLVFAEGYPPMAPTDGNRTLLALLSKVNQDIGRTPIEAVPPSRRGAADISFAAPHVPSMGGLGLLGDGDHSPAETVDLRSVGVSTKRAALLLYRLGQQQR